MAVFESVDKDEIAHAATAKDRLKIISQKNWSLLIAQVFGGLAGLLSTVWLFFESIMIAFKGAHGRGDHLFGTFESILKIFKHSPVKLNELDFFISSAFAQAPLNATSALHADAPTRALILSGIFVALFIWFLWSLVTLYRSPNANAVGVAAESTKMLGGFFIGAVTGFLGSSG